MANVILNPEQRRAVEHVRGPMLVVAGAGTGKTTVLVERVARLLQQGDARPDEVLAVTYTRNAAREMGERVRDCVGPLLAGGLNIATFHGYCYQLLERHGRRFGVIDSLDLKVYLRRRLRQRELPLERFIRAASPAQFLEALCDFFDRCHDELVNVADYERYADELFAGKHPPPRVCPTKDFDSMPREELLARCREIANVFRAVEDMLAKERIGTFGHLVLRAVELLRERPDVLAEEQKHARFLLIDEFQDVNFAQIELAALLAGAEANIFGVGDPDQAIYRFRGASSAAFDEFVERFPNTSTVTLVENRRSTSPVLDCAHEVISYNPAIAGGTRPGFDRQRLVSGREADAARARRPLKPMPVDVVLTLGSDSEASEIAETIVERQREMKCQCEGPRHMFGWCNFAILYRSHGHREQVVRELAARNIPFVVKGLDAINSAEVRDALAVLRAVQVKADPVSMFRLAALPQFQIAPKDLREKLATHRRDESMASVLRRVRGGEAVLEAVERAREFRRAREVTALQALDLLAAQFGLPMSDALNVLRDFVLRWEESPITKTRGLEEFLDYLDMYLEQGGKLAPADNPFVEEDPEIPDAVRLMTAHSAKGLEFEQVFVLRANSNSFPSHYHEVLFEFPQPLRRGASQDCDDKELHKQEERRLFYVAMTRARDALSILARPGTGKKERRPTGYLRELIDVPALAGKLRQREARPYNVAAIAAAAASSSTVGEWLRMPPARRLQDGPLSATALERYGVCPLQFKIERDWKLPTAAPAALRFGAAMHAALKAYGDAVVAGRPMEDAVLMQCFADALASLPIEDELQADLYARQGQRQLRALVAAHVAGPSLEVIAAEQGFEVEIGGAQVKGRMDRVDRIEGDRVVIVDYKTGSPKEQKEADESLQLSVYAIAAQKMGMKAERLVLHNLETNAAVETTRTAQQLIAATEKVSEVAARIADGDFEPNVGRHCVFCGYRLLCPETEEPYVTIASAGDGVT